MTSMADHDSPLHGSLQTEARALPRHFAGLTIHLGCRGDFRLAQSRKRTLCETFSFLPEHLHAPWRWVFFCAQVGQAALASFSRIGKKRRVVAYFEFSACWLSVARCC
jgi:hypothetical protein